MPTTQPKPTPTLLAEQIVAELRAQADADNVAGMAHYGITAENTLGVPVPVMRTMARDARKALSRDKQAWHELAALLWATGIHEAQIMATFIDLPALVDDAQAESWVADLDSWDTCDQLTNNVLRESPVGWAKAVEWADRDEEFVKRAAFVLGATIAVHDKKTDDRAFLPLLALTEREATDERNFVKKAVNWQIRQIGKRSAFLNAEAIAACERILEANPESKAARWSARDALRELTSDAIRARLGLL
jgi:3-methyladenine DNA glycosylase AlkD